MTLVILDRDGVINEDSDAYIKSEQEWQPIPGSIEAIARLSKAGKNVVVATNQSGLNRGLFSLGDLEAMHNKMRYQVVAAGGQIDGIYYCPHRPEENCGCRKPKTGLLHTIIEEWGSIAGTPFIGDSLRDLQAAVAMRCTPVLVETGKGLKTRQLLAETSDPVLSEVSVYRDLAEAVEALLVQ